MESYGEDLGLLLRGRQSVTLQDAHGHGLDMCIRLVRYESFPPGLFSLSGRTIQQVKTAQSMVRDIAYTKIKACNTLHF